MILYKCTNCGRLSKEINGFIPKKKDQSSPQPNGYGCNCVCPGFVLIKNRRGSPTDEGETTKANRVHEAGELKELKYIRKLLYESLEDRCQGTLRVACDRMSYLIQKHEGLDRE